MLNKLKWECIRLARATNQIHYLISNDKEYRVVNSANTAIKPGFWWIEFVGFKFTDTKKLIEEGVLFPR